LVGVHSEASLLWSGLVGWALASAHRSVGSGLSLSWSAGYAKMVSMALDEVNDWHSVDILLGEKRT